MMITNSALYKSCKCLSFLKRHMSGLVLNLVSQKKNGVEHNKLMHCTYLIKTVHGLGFEVHCRQITSIMQLILLVRQFTTFTLPIIHLLYPHTPEKAEQLTLFTIAAIFARAIELMGLFAPCETMWHYFYAVSPRCVVENVKVANFLCTS